MDIGSADAERIWAARLARTPFAAALARRAPLIVARGATPQLVFATPAALAAFQAPDAQALQDALFSSESAGARRLAQLAAELRPESPPRLERLRFFVARKPVTAPWLCARLTRDGESVFVAADLEASPEAAAPPPAAPAAAPLRFVWRLDAQNRFASPDPTLIDGLGAEAPREGETLDAFAARVRLGPEWPQAVAARETFTRLRVVWPEEGRAQARVAFVSGSPASAGAAYQGFRGFGLLTGERLGLAEPPGPKAAAPKAGDAPKPGDAAALLSMLQRQHPNAPAGSPQGPALAIISALATLLQAKPAPPRRPEPPPPAPAPPPSQSAEIVVLRPHASPEPRESESVALTSQERDAFKEIARQLGANVRDAPSAPREADPEPAASFAAIADSLKHDDEPAPKEQPKPAAVVVAPADSDFVRLVDTLPLAALILRDGEAVYANKTLIDLSGYKSLADFRARDGLKTIFRGRDPGELAAGGAVTGIPLVALSGRILTVDAQVRPISWAGEPAQLIAMRRSYEADHQEELRALEHEMAFHAARARDLAQALDAACDGMARIDGEGRILALNRSGEQLFGHNQGDVAGESFAILFALDSQTDVAGVLERLRKGEASEAKLNALARRADGTRFPVELAFGRLAGERDPEVFMLVKQAAATAATPAPAIPSDAGPAEKDSLAETELLSRVSHEMRTPLHAILGFAEVILEERMGPLGNERYRDYIKNIHDSGRHVLSLANDLLDLSRAELGKMELQFAPLDVNAIVRECVTLMQPQAARERVIVRLSLYDKLPNVMADERSLRQIMLNLMANAVKYNEPGGQVIVSTALDDTGHVILRVRDTGVGMNESELAIALEPFRRVPGGKAEGAGLGLPLTKALVEANHAGFSIKSRKDQGTLVEIAFPVRRAAQ